MAYGMNYPKKTTGRKAKKTKMEGKKSKGMYSTKKTSKKK